MSDLFTSEEDSGFHLDFFEFYNWGVFDGNVYRVDANGKSTLLTGENGSGKTTLVDAITTLLVPPQLRFYNQSSGSTHKKDRSEESYVLGAYGNLQNESSLSAKTQYLRKKENAVSILNGCFFDAASGAAVTLLQVRYFSGGDLQRILAVTEAKLSISQIIKTLEESGCEIDRGGKWKKILEKKFRTVFFGDNFKNYCGFFSRIFGLRSEKALKLFSQIVGLKVLGNLNEFIRTNMIEEIDAEGEFEKLQANYTKLLACDREIQKTKMQMELLVPVTENGKKWREAKSQKENADNLLGTVPFWQAKNAEKLLLEDRTNLETSLKATKENINVKKRQIDAAQSEIDSINSSLAANDTKRRIDEIEMRLSNLFDEKARIQNARENFQKRIEAVSSLEKNALRMPETQNQFEKLASEIQNLLEKNQNKKEEIAQKEYESRKENDDIKSEILRIESELKSLGTRNSNIPSENIRIREEICASLKIDESEIPFAGELIQVKKSEEKWNFAIERLLHNFALDILVPENLYKKVTEFVKSNRIGGEKGGRVIYLKTSENDFALEDLSNLNDENSSVPQKIEVRQNHPLTKWLSSYVARNFNYICTDDTNEIAASKYALTSSGLVKSGEKHEKDDRKKMRENFVQVLGWDNTQKRKTLSSELDFLKSEEENSSQKLLKIRAETKKNDDVVKNLSRLLETSSWDEIDVGRRVKEIDSLNDEKKKLESSKDLKNLFEKLNLKKIEKQNLDGERERLLNEQGKLESDIESTERQIRENQNALGIFTSDCEKMTLLEKTLPLLEKEYPRLTNAKTVAEVSKNADTMTSELNSKSSSLQRTVAGYELNITNAMNAVKNPAREIRAKFGDWSEEFSSLGNTKEYLDDYEAFYSRLKKDDLPKYQNEFHNYLHVTMKNDMIDFKQFLENGTTEVESAIANLNSSLKKITYNKNPDTYLQLILQKSNDTRIREFRGKLLSAIPDVARIAQNDLAYEEQIFTQIKIFLDSFRENEAAKHFVLDIRNWFTFAAKETFSDGKEKQFYSDSASLSGGEKAKLTYTILASAIAYQFGLGNSEASSFRFVIIDEAFSKSDASNSEYAMKLFKQLNLQLMVVTPLDKINIVEDYISSVHMTENKGTDDSRLISMTIERYKEVRNETIDVRNKDKAN